MTKSTSDPPDRRVEGDLDEFEYCINWLYGRNSPASSAGGHRGSWLTLGIFKE
jgi:hypothetical protein